MAAMREKRKEKGLTQKDLAGRVGVSQRMLSFIENGERKPTPDVAERIARELDWTHEQMWAELYRNPSYHKFI